MPGRVRPLAARHWLLRNPRRVWPVVAVQALVTALVLGVVTPLTGFEETFEVNLRPLRVYTAVTPMRRSTFDDDLTRLLDANPAQEHRIKAKALWMRTPMVVGETYTMLLALETADQPEFLRRVGNRLGEGILPEKDTEGVAIHRDVARARGLSIGDMFGRQVNPEDAAPGAFRVVGIVDGPSRVGIADLAYASRADYVLARLEAFEVVYAKGGRKAESDAYLEAAKDSDGDAAFKVWSEAFWRKRSEKAMENLPLVLDAVVGVITVVIALVVVLLQWISFQARSDEFALLLAVGRRRRRLVGKIALETLVSAALSWALGMGLGFAFLAVYDRLVLEPKAILIRFLDPYPIALASALPLVAAAASVAVLAWRLGRMDPVAVIQRRNA